MNYYTKIIALFLLMLTTACSSMTDPTEIETAEAINTEIPNTSIMVKSDLERELTPQIDPEDLRSLVQGNSEFALSFYNQIRQGEDNIIFSPISISLALSMTMAGAESSTEQDMLEALQIVLSEESVHPTFNALLQEIEKSQSETPEETEGSNFQLNIANSLWGQADYAFKENYLDTLAQHYGTGIYNVDFIQNPEAARQAINAWVEQATQDKIQDLVPPDAINSLTRLVLANAIYFNGSWRYPFNESATAEGTFFLLDGSETMVEMMKLSGERLPYSRRDSFQVVKLPYLSPDFVMSIILPDAGAFVEFEENLDYEGLKTALENMNFEEINLQMPKFDFTTTTNAVRPLSELGMENAFKAETADFSGITDEEELFITDVLHKATITIDEKGTEAAAATAVIVGITSAMPGEPIPLVIDRPFIFLIQHQPTGAILFMGRVTQP